MNWEGLSSVEGEHGGFEDEVTVWSSQSPREIRKRTSRANKICTTIFEKLTFITMKPKFSSFLPTALSHSEQIRL